MPADIIDAALPKSPIFWRVMTIIFLYTATVVGLVNYVPSFHGVEAKDITDVSSIAIGLIFAFRINSAYDRWWEGRKLWGQLVNDLRNLSIKFDSYFNAEPEEKSEFGRLLVVFAFSLRDHLRDLRSDLAAMGLRNVDSTATHQPLYVAGLIYRFLQARRSSLSHELDFLLLDRQVSALMEICGACERIRKSPIAGWFKASIWIWLITYLAVLPWLLVGELHAYTLLAVLFASYFGVALELLAEEIQEPFGIAPNDLPLDLICANIERSIQQVLHVVPAGS
jgi:putative membrane protein